MDASFDDRLTGFTEEQLDRIKRYHVAKQQSEQALRDALAVDGLELLHGSDCAAPNLDNRCTLVAFESSQFAVSFNGWQTRK